MARGSWEILGVLLLLGAGCGRGDSHGESATRVSERLSDFATVLGFENVTDWSTSAGTLGSSANVTQGSHSLSVSGIGYAEVRSVALSTPPALGNAVTFDLLLPSQQPNPFWFGTVQVLFDLPSQGLNSAFVGQVELTGLPTNVFQHLSINVPTGIAIQLQHTYSDLRIRIVLNVPVGTGSYLLDNFSFGSGSSGGAGGATGSGGTSGGSSGASGAGAASSSGAAGSLNPGGISTATGTFNGSTVPLVNAVSIRRTGPTNQVTVLLSDTPASCSVMQAGHAKGSNWFLALTVFSVQPNPSTPATVLGTGSYTIEDNGGSSAKRYVVASLTRGDSSCKNQLKDSDATSGTVTFTRLDATRVEGNYSVVFPNGNGVLAGTFGAPDCPLPPPTSDSVPTAAPPCDP